MAMVLRKTGISVVGDVPWGTHFCNFYETKEDLLDTLVPYFKAGLENNEFCLWVVADPLIKEEARRALEKAVPDLDEHFLNGNIEILDGQNWYLTEDVFTLERVATAWDKKLEQALARGYEGMRVSGDTFWLREKDRKDFSAYEKQLNDSITDRPMTLLCTYPLANSGAAEIFNVAQTHQFAIAKRRGHWEMVETPELKQAKFEIARLNEELEQRVIERTIELTAANECLRKEIIERKQAEEKLKRSESQLAEAQRVAHVGYWERNIDTGEFTWSDETYRIFGLQPQEPLENLEELIHPEDWPVQVEATARALRGEPYDVEYRVVRPDGEVRLVHSQGEAIRDESGRPRRAFGTVQDVTELKRAEEKLKATSEQLRALSARVQFAREEEGIRIAREIHDELGSALTSLRWDLEGIEKTFAEPGNRLELPEVRKKITAMLGLTDTTINIVRRIASELRPNLLDDIGLVAAMRWQVRQFEAQAGIVCQCDFLLEDVNLDQQQSTAIFRVFQEALTNVIRHAEATRVNITLDKEGDELVLTIQDNGRGITTDEKSDPRSLGLLRMRERVNLIGGTIHFTGVEGKGTEITVRVSTPRKS